MGLDFVCHQMGEQFIEKASQQEQGCAGEGPEGEEGSQQVEEQGQEQGAVAGQRAQAEPWSCVALEAASRGWAAT